MELRTQAATNVRNRRGMDPSVPKKDTPPLITDITATAADTIQITFNMRVQKNKLPGYTAGAGGAETVMSATKVTFNVVELVFTGEVQGTDLIVGGADAGIRSPTGGFVPAGTYPVPTFP